MRIHSDHLTRGDIVRAARAVTEHTSATVDIDGPHQRGSRTHATAWEVKLTGDGTQSRRRVNYGSSKAWDRFDRPYAATWEQWGWFLAHLFDVDPAAVVGSPGNPIYADREDFLRKTATAQGRTAGWVTAAV